MKRLVIRLIQDYALNPWGFCLVAYRQDDNGDIYRLNGVGEWNLFRKADDMSASFREAEPLLCVDIHNDAEALQRLMDDLWQAGVRPKDIGAPGHLAATQAHLNDFRAIVAKQLDIKLP